MFGMKPQGLKRFPDRGTVYLLLLFCLSGIQIAEPIPVMKQPEKMGVLRFDCDGVEKVIISNRTLDRRQYEEMTCTNSTRLLPEGEYEIHAVVFRGGLTVEYKHKTVDLVSGSETVITFARPTNNSLEIVKQGTFYSIKYNPKAYYDEEFYYNQYHPPIIRILKNNRIIFTETFAYG